MYLSLYLHDPFNCLCTCRKCKVIVFFATCDSVDFYYKLLSRVWGQLMVSGDGSGSKSRASGGGTCCSPRIHGPSLPVGVLGRGRSMTCGLDSRLHVFASGFGDHLGAVQMLVKVVQRVTRTTTRRMMRMKTTVMKMRRRTPGRACGATTGQRGWLGKSVSSVPSTRHTAKGPAQALQSPLRRRRLRRPLRQRRTRCSSCTATCRRRPDTTPSGMPTVLSPGVDVPLS